ncbi:MAG: helix-turn-helix domain-containing protein [Lachnospiraceae bacterium]|nr:helix-turn-helix domain-containing protein [Lachnospiraceae bacterium]
MGLLDKGLDIDVLSFAFSVIEGKWKIYILFWLCKSEVMRYSDLRRALGPVTHNVLSSKLKELEADGLIIRCEYPQVPPKVEYSLSEKGKAFIPVLERLCEWGETYMEV